MLPDFLNKMIVFSESDVCASLVCVRCRRTSPPIHINLRKQDPFTSTAVFQIYREI